MCLYMKWSEFFSVMSKSLQSHGYSTWNKLGQNTREGSLSLLQGIFPTQGSNPGLSHCRQILYQLSHKGSPRILEWVAYPFSSGSSWSGIELGSLTLQTMDSLPTELSGKLHMKRKWKWSCSVVTDSLWPHGLKPTRLLPPWDSPGKSTGVGCHFLLQGIFQTQGSNPGLPHSRQTL